MKVNFRSASHERATQGKSAGNMKAPWGQHNDFLTTQERFEFAGDITIVSYQVTYSKRIRIKYIKIRYNKYNYTSLYYN